MAQPPVLHKTNKNRESGACMKLWVTACGAASQVHLQAAEHHGLCDGDEGPDSLTCLYPLWVTPPTQGQEVDVICHRAVEDSAGTETPTLLFLGRPLNNFPKALLLRSTARSPGPPRHLPNLPSLPVSVVSLLFPQPSNSSSDARPTKLLPGGSQVFPL